ncbi:MAG: hypothetical protein K5675_05995 [Lachnospiraceae bacterium]|nr:hypothetical protein [Lachnospiraceae bacterium]
MAVISFLLLIFLLQLIKNIDNKFLALLTLLIIGGVIVGLEAYFLCANITSNRKCDNKDTIWTGTCSYIEAVKWSSFIKDYQKYIEKAIERQDNIDEYNIYKEV